MTLLTFFTSEHFSPGILLRLIGIVMLAQQPRFRHLRDLPEDFGYGVLADGIGLWLLFVDFGVMSCGCGTPTFGIGVSTGGRAHSPPASCFLPSAALSLVTPSFPCP